MAARLTHGDLRAVLRCLASWDVRGGYDALAASVTAALPALISADVTVLASADMRRGRLHAIEYPHVTAPADLDTFIQATHERPHPLLAHFARTGDPEARRVTDLVSRQEFRRLPVYVEFYRKFGLESVMGAVLNNHPSSFDGITIHRGRRDFDERDRSVLSLLRPHLLQAYRTVRTVDRLRADLMLALRAIETPGFGLVVLSGARRPRLVSPQAAAWLRAYFDPPRRADRLPESLDRWVRHHLDGGADSSGLPPIRAPLVVERGEARLVAHLVAEGSEALLLLEGQTTRRDPARLAALGLSPRESEVLGGVAEGRTTREIAATLGLSPRTVQTYLERVFAKLGVETRAAAVARALRWEPMADPAPT